MFTRLVLLGVFSSSAASLLAQEPINYITEDIVIDGSQVFTTDDPVKILDGVSVRIIAGNYDDVEFEPSGDHPASFILDAGNIEAVAFWGDYFLMTGGNVRRFAQVGGLPGQAEISGGMIAQLQVVGAIHNTGEVDIADFSGDVIESPTGRWFVPDGHVMGDATFNSSVGLEDLNLVRNHFDSGILADVDFDGEIGLSDLNLVRNNFGSPSFAVPEPSSLCLALTSMFLWRARYTTHPRRRTRS